MTKKNWIGGAALGALLVTGVAIAAPGQDGGPTPPKNRAEVQARIADHFKKADSNGDGFVTKAEVDAQRDAMRAKFAEKRAERRGEHFAALDKDKNGALSKDEYMAPRPEMRDGKRGPGRDGPGGRHGRGGWNKHGGGFGGFAMGGRWFDAADANKDGKVSLAEAQTAGLARFDSADTNRDGVISPEEHKAAREAMRAKWQERRQADKQG